MTTGVQITENPHRDPVTIAWSTLDVCAAAVADAEDAAVRLRAKADKTAAELAAIKAAFADADAAVKTAVAARKDAQAALDKVEADNPELAAEVSARRTSERAQRIAQLEVALAAAKEA